MNNPLVSILIPVFNSALYLEETLNSCVNQTYKNIEIIVVDDGSTDNSLELVKNYAATHRANIKIIAQAKQGACSARNVAFNNSSGDYIQYLDSDDLLPSRKIELQLKRLEEFDYKEDIIAFSGIQFLQNGELVRTQKRSIDRDYDNPKELIIDLLSTVTNLPHSYLTPRYLVEKSCGWDEVVIKNQDGEFFSRILYLADKAVFVPNNEVTWRLTGTGISNVHSIETIKSQLYVADKISDLILSYSTSERAKAACAAQYGWITYLGYPENKLLIPQIMRSLKKRNLPFFIPYKGRLFRLLSIVMGWRVSSIIVKNRITMKIVAAIRNSFHFKLKK